MESPGVKLIGFLLMTVALVLGTIATTTAYVPKLDPALAGLTLNLSAGKSAEGTPILQPDTVLTTENIAELKAANVKRVRVKEFSFPRWTHWPHFVIGVALMIVGALLVKMATKRQIAEGAASTEENVKLSPSRLVEQIEQDLASLRSELENLLDTNARVVTIVDRVSDILGDRVLPFYDTRPTLIGKFGLAGFAGIMDRVSALERSLNRAWSAAADEHEPEAMASLEQAASIMVDVKARLGMTA
jgi:hypothetical protein